MEMTPPDSVRPDAQLRELLLSYFLETVDSQDCRVGLKVWIRTLAERSTPSGNGYVRDLHHWLEEYEDSTGKLSILTEIT